jgi:hypothetical protein
LLEGGKFRKSAAMANELKRLQKAAERDLYWFEKLLDEREKHRIELRKIDNDAKELERRNVSEHFHQLNENALRTIEERGHFVSREAYDPFAKQVLETLSAIAAGKRGAQDSIGWIVGAIGLIATIVIAYSTFGSAKSKTGIDDLIESIRKQPQIIVSPASTPPPVLVPGAKQP